MNGKSAAKRIGGDNLSLTAAFFILQAMASGDNLCGAIHPEMEKCILQVGQQTLKPSAVMSDWRARYDVGEKTYFVGKDEVGHSPQTANARPWTVRSADGHCLHWLASDSNTAYLIGYEVDKDGGFTRYDSPPRLRRLNLATGSWMADLPTTAGYPAEAIVAVTADDQDVVVLTAKSYAQTVAGYELLCFRQGAAKPLWSKSLPSSGERPYTGAYLWGIPRPNYAGSDIQHVTWMDDRLLVCPEAMQPLYCLNRDTGSEIWRLERIWEFQRGFIGPSVYAHYIARFGIEEFGAEDRGEVEVREEFNERFTCALVAGPIAVPLGFERGSDSHSIFVAVARGPAGAWAGYLSDCIVYEISDEGQPISMATLPQMVKGSQHSTQQDGVIWRCQNDTFVKLRPAQGTPVVSMGGGGADGTSCVAWLRHLPHAEPAVWFSAGKAQDAVEFGENHAFCLPTGGYVARDDSPIYRFPISAVDLATGLDMELLLEVPFKGKIPIPETNYSSSTLPDGTRSFRTRMEWQLAITGLRLHHDQLEIVLGMENWAGSVTFDLSKALGQRQVSTDQVGTGDPVAGARARVRALDPRSLNETLSSATHGNDVAFLKALLEAGADPKVASKSGSTALMDAAAYGTAAMVDALIAAGSDVNARDGKHGGQTALMSAAWSRKESKRKVQSLLKAGANKDSTSQNGYNALMWAAMHGDLVTVELLLQAGMKVSHRNADGETVLMVAAEAGNANVVKVLIDAGADVGSKDKKGRTALRIAEASDRAGADQVVKLLKSAGHPK